MNEHKTVVNKSTLPVGAGRKVAAWIREELERVVIGSDSSRAREKMKEVYRVLYFNETPLTVTFINEVANLCEAVGANVQDVARAMGKDGRVGPKFLHPGPGYGGSFSEAIVSSTCEISTAAIKSRQKAFSTSA